MFSDAAELARKDEQLKQHFQFSWTDGNSIPNSVIMGDMIVPSK